MRDMTAEEFFMVLGRKPENDDLERVNCPKAGKSGHMSCGWNWSWNAPCFEVGHQPKTNYQELIE